MASPQIPDASVMVTSVPDILENIFLHSDIESNVVNLCVCRCWYLVCRRIVWREVSTIEKLKALFQILSPVAEKRFRKMSFVTWPKSAAWKRFLEYSHLVQSLTIVDAMPFASILEDVVTLRPCFNLFPHLKYFSWSMIDCPRDSDHLLCLLFMHSQVETFAVNIKFADFQSPTVADAVSRMSCLRHLRAEKWSLGKDGKKQLLEVLQDMRNLETITLPAFETTQEVVEKLARLPRLTTLKTDGDGEELDASAMAFNFYFYPQLPDDAYPFLQELTITSFIESASEFIVKHNFCRNLLELHVEHLPRRKPEHVMTLLSTIANECQQLSGICLTEYGYASTELSGAEAQHEITLDMLRPLASCVKLKRLEIRSRYVLQIENAAWKEFLSNHPQLEILHLNAGPVNAIRSPVYGLGDALATCARMCPNIQVLGLCADATSADSLKVDEPFEFAKLRKLSVGASPIKEVDPVALFLAQVLPRSCTLEFVDDRAESWAAVSRQLPLLIQMREISERRALCRAEVRNVLPDN